MPEPLARRALAVALVAFIAAIFGSAITSSLFAAVTGKAVDSFGANMAGIPGQWLGMLGVPIAASRRWGSGDVRRDYLVRFEWNRDVPAGIGVGLVGQFLIVTPVVLLFHHFSHGMKVTEQSVDVAKKAHGGGLVLVVLLFAFGAPIVEEIFFRGVLLGGLLRRMPAWIAVAVSGVVFGFVHFSGGGAGGWAVVVALVVFGWLLGAMAVRSGRLGPCIVAHTTFNVIATVGLIADALHGK